MDKQSALDFPTEYWYGAPEAIEHFFCGVFEGGGAKGVAYAGALLAMAQQKCWFSAVAGASAGAITAALVASGLSPEDMGSATDEALKLVQTGVWAGLRGLRSGAGYFQSDGLYTWLNALLVAQVKKSGVAPSAAVTFGELYAATRIELNVVSTDLSLNAQIVFSYIDTPECAVADAVVASSSIPFAFASRLLQIEDGEELFHDTIVDGGVWSNFPMYIFEDKTFREFYGRTPVELEPARILGFVLQEHQEQLPPRASKVRFVDPVPAGQFRVREWSSGSKTDTDVSLGFGSRIVAGVLYPFSLLGRFVDRNTGVDRGRWPTPRSPLARRLVQSINGLLGGTSAPLLGVVGFVIVAIGAWQVITFFAIDQLNALRATDWSEFGSYVVRPLSMALTLLAVAISILVVFASLVGFATNYLLLRISRRVAYGLVTTYVAGPGSPKWVTSKGNIIALPIPPGLTTLSFAIPPESRRNAIASAKQATLTRLRTLLHDEDTGGSMTPL